MSHVHAGLLFALTTLVTVHASAQAVPPLELAPPRRVLQDERPNWPVIAPGIALFGAGWIANAVTSLPAGICGPEIRTTPGGTGCHADPGWDGFRIAGLVPLVGPWIQLAAKPGSLGDDGWAAWLIADGLVQAAGLITLIVGVANPRAIGSDDLALVPWAGPRGAGLGLVGSL